MTKIVDAYIPYDLDVWPRIPTNNFIFKNCLFGAASIVNNSYKEKNVHSGYGITFDSACSWSVDYDTDRNFKIFGVNNSLSYHALNPKNNFLVLGEDPTFWINGSFGSPE